MFVQQFLWHAFPCAWSSSMVSIMTFTRTEEVFIYVVF